MGDTFDLFDAGNVAPLSTFDSIVFNAAGYAGSLNYAAGTLTITAVPEPCGTALMLAGGAALVFSRRSRRGKQV